MKRKRKKTFVKVSLSDGNYSWLVYCGEYIDGDGDILINGRDDGFVDEQNMLLLSKNIDLNTWGALAIDTIKGYKDSKFLFLGYGQDALEYKWDAIHADMPEASNAYRCWLVAAQIMNHVYGGNVTQDEILFATRFNNDEPLVSPFFPIGADSVDRLKALRFALQTDSITQYGGTPSYSIVKKEIDQGRPIYVSSVYWSGSDSKYKDHAMVIYGYVGKSDNYAFLYAFGNNYGFLTNSVGKTDSISEYLLVKATKGSVAMHDSRLDMDSDGDGITDFDEIERFGTNPYSIDSDGDGMDDKKEIFDYTIKSKYDEKIDMTFPDRAQTVMSKIAKKSNEDGDEFRKESDNDDNGDGINDGLEGNVNFQIDNMDVPLDYTLFARSHLVLNDGVKCFDLDVKNNILCRVGVGGGNNFSYNSQQTFFLMGVNSRIGNADVRLPILESGRAFLRNSAIIQGDLNLHILTAGTQPHTVAELGQDEPYLVRQSNVLIGGNINLKYYEYYGSNDDWKGNYQCNLSKFYDVPNMGNKSVDGGSFLLTNGASYSSLKIQGNSRLIIPPGEFYIDSLLQIESGTRIEFLNPGESSIIHLNGKLIWRPQNDISLSDAAYWTNVARGFKLIQHSSEYMLIEGFFGGTIYAPLSELILGQVNKKIYGRFLAKDITVHQYAEVFRVDYDPISEQSYAIRSLK